MLTARECLIIMGVVLNNFKPSREHLWLVGDDTTFKERGNVFDYLINAYADNTASSHAGPPWFDNVRYPCIP